MEAHVRIGLDELTATQRRVLRMMADGATNPAIAATLGISLDGAKWHVREILSKLQVATREEAADIWREEHGLRRRLWRQAWRALLSTGRIAGPLKVTAAGVLATALVVAGIVVAVALTRGDSGIPAAAPTVEPPAITETATSGTPTQSVDEDVTTEAEIERPPVQRYGPGATIEEQSGVLLFDAATGGSEVWDVSPLGRPSPSGRYMTISLDCADTRAAAGSCAWTTAGLLDTTTGEARPILVGTEPAITARVTADERHLVAVTKESIGLFSLPGLEIEQEDSWGAGEPWEGVTFAYSADGNAIGVTRTVMENMVPASLLTDIVTEAAIIPSPVAGQMAWAHGARRLAVIGEKTGVVIDVASGSMVELERGYGHVVLNTSPQWSPDDRYVAIPFDDDVGGVTAFDTTTGKELVRVYGAPGCPVLWTGTDTLLGSYYDAGQGSVRVPGGEVVAGWPQLGREPIGPYVRGTGDGGWQLVGADGSVMATARITGMSSAPFNWSWEWRDGPSTTALLLGVGGRDVCGGQPAPITVVLPPFDAAEIPTATPTQ